MEKEKDPIYFSMTMPNWLQNKSVEEKCGIIEALVEQLKDKPISPQQRKELFCID